MYTLLFVSRNFTATGEKTFFFCQVGWRRKISVKFFRSLFPRQKIENIIMTTNLKIVKSDVINESNNKTIVGEYS